MTGETARQEIERMPQKMTKKDIKILDDLLFRTENLPDILHLRAAEIGYHFTDQDKELLLDIYSKLDDILKAVAAFINIKFPGCERHVKAWNEIDFDTKIGPIKIVTTDREHIKREWRKGMFDLKSLVKTLMNETTLLLDDKDDGYNARSLKDISSNRTIDYYTNEKNIPNQKLVTDTITYFETGDGVGSFQPIDFLNLLDKQHEFVKLNHDKGEVVIEHLKNLYLSDREKHTLYGFILKWFGGYPINNLNEDFDRTLKLIQKEFLGFNGETPEKQFCKADQAMRNKFEKLGIAFTTAINNNIDVNEILAAMDIDEPSEKSFLNFNEIFSDIVNEGLIGDFHNRKTFLITQSTYNYQFNLWLQTHKDWEYRNEEQYIGYLTKDVFIEFLAYRNADSQSPSSSSVSISPTISSPATTPKLTLRQIALICHYTDRLVTRETAKTIVEEYMLSSGDALFNRYSFYRSKANRTGVENTRKKNENKVELFESVLSYLNLNGSEKAKSQIVADIEALKDAISKSGQIL